MELIAESGLDTFTLRKLADHLSVSAPALYSHFTDKHDLLRAVAERFFENLIELYQEIDAKADPARPLDRVREQCRNYVRMAQEDTELFRVMFLFPPDLGGAVPDAGEDALPLATTAFKLGANALEDAVALGHVDAEDAFGVVLVLWAGVHGIASLLMLGLPMSAQDRDALVDELTGRLLRGYGATY